MYSILKTKQNTHTFLLGGKAQSLPLFLQFSLHLKSLKIEHCLLHCICPILSPPLCLPHPPALGSLDTLEWTWWWVAWPVLTVYSENTNWINKNRNNYDAQMSLQIKVSSSESADHKFSHLETHLQKHLFVQCVELFILRLIYLWAMNY